jgi:hypothetical protein
VVLNTQIVCACTEIVMKSQDGAVKLRSKIVIFKGEQGYAICKSCGVEVKIPVRLSEDALNPPLILHIDRHR